jgi:hypothetical protein
MSTFKEFLSEHIILGDFKKSPIDLYYVSPSYSDKSKLVVYPKIEGMKYNFNVIINDAGLDIIDDIYEKWSKTNEDYPHKGLEKALDNRKNDILKNSYLHSEDLLDKDLIKEINDTLYKKDNISSSLSSSLIYGFRGKGFISFKEYSKKNPVKILVQVQSIYKLIVNTKTKSIYPDSNPIGHANRIGTHSNSKTMYVIPMSDISIENPREIYKILQSLVKKYPYMKNFSYIDILSRNQARIKVEDVLNGAGEVGKVNTNYQNIFNKTGDILVYHGTSEKIYKNFIEKKGLRPGLGQHYVDKIVGHSENNLYFTNDIGDARKYAVRASGASSRSIVLEVKIRDYDKITFDEDNLQSGIERIPEKVLKQIKTRLYNIYIENGSDDKLWAFQHIPEYVSEKGLDSTDVEAWQLKRIAENGGYKYIESIMRIIGYYAIGGSSFTFAYKGVILPKDIKVKETFKSKAYKDSGIFPTDLNKKNFRKKYSNILKTFK